MNNFEYKIKNRLDNYNSEIDPYEIWEGIKAKQKQKKKRRWGFLWLAAAVLLLISIVIVNPFDKNNPETQIAKNTNSPKTTSSVNPNSGKNDSSLNDNNTSNQNADTKPNISNNDKSNINTIASNSQNKQRDNIAQNSGNDNSSITKIHNTFATAGKVNIPGSASKTANKKQNSNEVYSVENKDSKSIGTHNSPVLTKVKNTYLQTSIKHLVYDRQLLALNYQPVLNKITPKNFFNKKPYPEISIAANYIHNKFDLTDEASETFMQNVSENEKQLEAFDIYFTYNIPVYKNFSFVTGLNYGQIDSKLDFTYKEIREVEIDNALTKVVYKSLTDTLKIYERAKTTGEFSIHDIKYNYRRYLRIPVLVAYSSKINSLGYEIRSGIDLNILTCSNAEAITPDGKTVALKKTDENLRKNHILGDFHFDLRLKYELNKHLIFTFGPQYKVNLTSLMQQKAGFNLYRHSLGLNVGAKFKI